MRHGPATFLLAKFALFVLLAFQLVVELSVQAAGAQRPIAEATPRAECPMHGAKHDAAPANHAILANGATPASDAALANGATLPHGTNKHTATGNHDCCHASACQCHCVSTPVAVDLPALANLATSVKVPSLSSAQFVAPRIDEFLRPPIA